MRHRSVCQALLLAVLVSAPGSAAARADDAAPEPVPSPSPQAAAVQPASAPEPAPPGPPAIEISGFVDTYYGFNFNRPAGGNQLRNFDTKHNQIGLSLIEIAFEQKPAEGSPLGFRADLDFGPTTDMVHASEPGGADVFKTFEQAYLSALAPLGKGLQVDVGKFVTPHGAEVIEAKDNWNYSRSLLFALAIPYYHVGLRASLPVGSKLTLAGYAVNGWNDDVDNNSGKTFGLQAVVKPAASVSVVQNLMRGPEQAGNRTDKRLLSDTTVSWNVTPELSLMVNGDYGRDTFAGQNVMWRGVAGYARYQFPKGFALAPRVEWLDDGDGFMTGTPQKLTSLTLTGEFKVDGRLLGRLELRRDSSDSPFFKKQDGLVKSQTTVTLGLVYSFASKL